MLRYPEKMVPIGPPQYGCRLDANLYMAIFVKVLVLILTYPPLQICPQKDKEKRLRRSGAHFGNMMGRAILRGSMSKAKNFNLFTTLPP